MQIGLIAMSGVRVKSAELAALGVTLPGFVRRGKVIASLPSLGLFRSRGTRVIMGGLHVSHLPHEALTHADAILRFGAEAAWMRAVKDAERDCLQPIYEGAMNEVFSPSLYAMPRFDLLAGRQYNRVTVQTSRGCPRACEFCAASLRITSQFNQKPVDLVIAEIRAAKRHVRRPYFEFADDNTFLNHRWSKQLLRALRDEEIHYFTETDVSVADDLELCDLLSESGCRQVLIGFESPHGDDLDGIDPASWKSRQAPRYRRVIDVLQSRGVSVNGCFILGLDSHTPDIFPAVLDFVRSSGLAEIQYTVMTPFPGTPLFDRLRSEGRLLQDKFWDSCTLFDVNFK